MGLITFDLILFYAIAFVICWAAYYWKSNFKLKLESFLLAIMTIFVAREYWEIPVFVTGYLGILNPNFPMIFHHLLVLLVFAVLVVYSKIKFTKPIVATLILTPIFISPLILWGSWNPLRVYLARIIGTSIFGGIFVYGSSILRV